MDIWYKYLEILHQFLRRNVQKSPLGLGPKQFDVVHC